MIIPISLMRVAPSQLLTFVRLLQASGGYIGRVADGVAGYKKFNSPVLLAARGAIV